MFLLLTAWALSLVVTSIPFVVFKRPNDLDTECHIDVLFGNRQRNALSYLSISYIVPLLITDILYIFSCARLYKIRKNMVISLTPAVSTGTSENSQSISGVQPAGYFCYQRQVFRTIGILLFMLNLFVVPMIIVFALGAMKFKLTRDLRYIASILIYCNSAINPLIYAVRITFLRKALRELWPFCKN